MAVVVTHFNYTGAKQVWTVPANVTSATFELYGAAGGASGGGMTAQPDYWFLGALGRDVGQSTYPGDLGWLFANPAGYTQAVVPVTAGDVYNIYVGGNGGLPDVTNTTGGTQVTAKRGTAGWNGGAAGGQSVVSASAGSHYYAGGGGGGGATDVRHGGTALANRILVAGGSGGAGGWSDRDKATFTNCPTTPVPPYRQIGPEGTLGTPLYPTQYISTGPGRGGAVGNLNGTAGGDAQGTTGASQVGTNGGGGTQTAGGAAGVAAGGAAISGTAGALGVGGGGASSTTTTSLSSGTMAGGGGGGGYYGGGGGATGYDGGKGAGGGAGSNFVATTGITSSVTYGFVYPHQGSRFSNNIDTGDGDYADGHGGVCIITYIQTPNAPTINAPDNNSYISPTQDVTITHTFVYTQPVAPAQIVTPVADNGQPAITGYDIQYRQVGSGTWTLQNHVATSSTNTTTITHAQLGQTAGNSYEFQVRYYDYNGDVGPWADLILNCIALPAAPVITAPTSGQVVTASTYPVTWTNPSGSPELAYYIENENTQAGTTGPLVGAVGGWFNSNTRVNWCPNPSFEQNVTLWTFTGGSAVRSSTNHMTPGSWAAQVTWAASGSALMTFNMPTVEGQQYFVTAWVMSPTASDPTMYEIGARNVGDTVPSLGSSDTSVAPGTWTQLSLVFTADSPTTTISIEPTQGTVTSGQITWLDNIDAELWVGPTGRALPTYFDGSAANGNTGTASWLGTANLSASQLLNADFLSTTLHVIDSFPVRIGIRYATVGSQGAPSNMTSVFFTLNHNPPGTPTATVTMDEDAGSISFHIHVNDSPNQTTSVDVYRQDLTNGTDEIRIAADLAPDPASRTLDFTDVLPASRTLYNYRIRAYSAVGGYADIT